MSSEPAVIATAADRVCWYMPRRCCDRFDEWYGTPLEAKVLHVNPDGRTVLAVCTPEPPSLCVTHVVDRQYTWRPIGGPDTMGGWFTFAPPEQWLHYFRQ